MTGIRYCAIIIVIATLPALVIADGGQIYKWLDEDGNLHYTDSPPPPGRVAEEVTVAPRPTAEDAGDARKHLERLIEDQEASYSASQKQKEEQEARRVEEQELEVQRKKKCASSRQSLRALQTSRPVYSIDDRGEYVFLSDDERAATIKSFEKSVAENCQEN